MSFDQHCCALCKKGLKDKNEGEILLRQCAGCRLIEYCSQECQKSDWKNHKQMCKIAQQYPVSSKSLKLEAKSDDGAFLDFDAILLYAQKYHMKVEHFSISISQECLLRDLMGQYGKTFNVILSPLVLHSFLNSQKENMISFRWVMDDCCWEYTSRFTDAGRAFIPLTRMTQLESFDVVNPVFDDVDDVQALLSGLKNLKHLSLRSMRIDSFEGNPWTESEAVALARCIGTMPHLVNLTVSAGYFRSQHIGMILCILPNLRCLDLSGHFGPNHKNWRNLEDADCRFIAQACPKLQELDLSCNRYCSHAGIEAILRGCPHLRTLSLDNIPIPHDKIPYLLQLHSKLLLFRCCDIPTQPKQREAIMATHGRTLIVREYHGLLEVPDLPPHVMQTMATSKAIVQAAGDRGLCYNSSRVYNRYEAIELVL